MKRTILPFEREEISIDEMLEHANWYSMKADEGMRYLGDKDNKSSMEILRGINTYLKMEYTHYSKVSVRKKLIGNKVVMAYIKEITSCYVKQTRPNSYDLLRSNLYDVSSYANNFITYIECDDLA